MKLYDCVLRLLVVLLKGVLLKAFLRKEIFMGKDLKGKELGRGLRQNKDKRYEGRYTDRFGKRVSVYANTETSIRQKLKKAKDEDSQKLSVKNRYTLNQWYEIWLELYKKDAIKESSLAMYKVHFTKHILPEIGNMYLDDIQPLHVRMLMKHLEEKHYKSETRNRVKILISDMFNTAMENQYALINPTKGIKVSRDDVEHYRALTRDEQETFFRCCAGTFYDNFFVVDVNTGLRPGEMFALTESDIDFDNSVINVSKTLIYQKFEGDQEKTFHIGSTKTKTSTRKVPINSACKEALMRQIQLKKVLSNKYPDEGEFSDILFVSKLNTPLCAQTLCDAIKRIVSEINLQRDEIDQFPLFSGHTFRHTFATRCIESGVQPKALQKILGHANINMTMNLYVHAQEDFVNDEFKKLECIEPKINMGY